MHWELSACLLPCWVVSEVPSNTHPLCQESYTQTPTGPRQVINEGNDQTVRPEGGFGVRQMGTICLHVKSSHLSVHSNLGSLFATVSKSEIWNFVRHLSTPTFVRNYLKEVFKYCRGQTKHICQPEDCQVEPLPCVSGAATKTQKSIFLFSTSGRGPQLCTTHKLNSSSYPWCLKSSSPIPASSAKPIDTSNLAPQPCPLSAHHVAGTLQHTAQSLIRTLSLPCEKGKIIIMPSARRGRS